MFYSQVSNILYFFCFISVMELFLKQWCSFHHPASGLYPVWDKAGRTFHKKPGLELEVEKKKKSCPFWEYVHGPFSNEQRNDGKNILGFAGGQALVTRFSGAGVELMPSDSPARTSACSQAPRRSGTRLCPSGGPYLQREVRSRSVLNNVFIYSFFWWVTAGASGSRGGASGTRCQRGLGSSGIRNLSGAKCGTARPGTRALLQLLWMLLNPFAA